MQFLRRRKRWVRPYRDGVSRRQGENLFFGIRASDILAKPLSSTLSSRSSLLAMRVRALWTGHPELFRLEPRLGGRKSFCGKSPA
jgi:hypothetical protein